MNFKNFGNGDVDGGEGRHTPGTYPLTRQGSIYSLTFDELQSTLGSVGKDFGSMNMDELLKSIWSAEETQTMQIAGSSTAAGPQMNLNRQGSLTLPRTMSQRTVDEVWRDMSREDNVGNLNLGSSFNQRQLTLGEMTLEDFLVKAGVVREDIPLTGNPDNGGYFGEFSQSSNSNGLGIGFQQAGQNMGLMGDRMDNSNLPLNFNGARSSQQPLPSFPMQTGVPYGTTIPLPAIAKMGSPKIRDGIVGYSDPGLNGNLSSDGIGKTNGDTSSVSPVPYAFNGVIRGRKHGAVEKVVERRQRRMIKNRESAARSRARKQAYTTELEAEVAKLKEENEELRKKQAEIVELQKKQELEMKDMQQGGGKRRCLRRTQTNSW